MASAPRTTKTDDASQLEPGSAALPLLGIDGEGGTHYYSPERSRLEVWRDGELDQVETINRSALKRWIAYVEEERGWEQEPISGDYAGTIAGTPP